MDDINKNMTTGVLEDPRSEEEKLKDYNYDDLAHGEVKLNWIEYNEKHLKTYPIQNQDGSSSCVSQGTSKILAMHEVKEGRSYKQLCPKFIYLERSNYPQGGMWFNDALNIAIKHGSCEERLMPCDSKGESFMNEKNKTEEQIENAKIYKAKAYFNIPIDIDKIAEVIEQGYGVLMGFRFDHNEWTDVPKRVEGTKMASHHGVAIVDYVMYKGEKALIMEDSWGPKYGKGGRRIITESFLMEKGRCSFVGYVTSLDEVKYVFKDTLRVGSRGLPVKMLQNRLGITADGIFGKNTKLAVQAFQLKNHLVADGIVGKITNSYLNKNE